MIGAGLRIAAPDIRRIPPVSAFKAGDQSVTAPAGGVSGFIVDSDLNLNLDGNSTYRLLATLYYTGPATNWVQAYLSPPEPVGTAGGWTVSWSVLRVLDTTGTPVPWTTVQRNTAFQAYCTGSLEAIFLTGTVQTTAAGILGVYWEGQSAIGSGAGTYTMNAGSELDAWKIA